MSCKDDGLWKCLLLVITFQLSSGAHICTPNVYGIYPIHVAIKYCNEKCLELLVASKHKHNIPPNKILNFADKEGNVPLHTAVNTGDTRAVQVSNSLIKNKLH